MRSIRMPLSLASLAMMALVMIVLTPLAACDSPDRDYPEHTNQYGSPGAGNGGENVKDNQDIVREDHPQT